MARAMICGSMALTYETFRQSNETRWLAGQRSGNVAAEQLHEQVLFRLADRAGYTGLTRLYGTASQILPPDLPEQCEQAFAQVVLPPESGGGRQMTT